MNNQKHDRATCIYKAGCSGKKRYGDELRKCRCSCHSSPQEHEGWEKHNWYQFFTERLNEEDRFDLKNFINNAIESERQKAREEVLTNVFIAKHGHRPAEKSQLNAIADSLGITLNHDK